MNRAGILLSYFLIGASGIIFEVSSARLLALSVGSSGRAAALVVASFVGGFGLGSFLGGKLADRSASPLVLFGRAAILMGLYFSLVPFLVAAAGPLLGAVYRFEDGPSNPLFAAAGAVLLIAVSLPAALLLGALFPFLARHLARSLGEVGAWLGSLQAVSALGGFLGAWSTALLIPWLGLRLTPAIAGLVSAFLGGMALLRARGQAVSSSGPDSGPPPPAVPVPTPPPARRGLVLGALVVAGAVNMVLQLAWIRAVHLSLGTHLYSLIATAGAILMGLGLGSALCAGFADRLKSPQAALGWSMAGVAACAGVTTPALGVFPHEFAHGISGLHVPMGFLLFLILGGAWASALIFPSAMLMGVSLPLAGRALTGSLAGIGRGAGYASGAGALGALLGAALMGTVLLPLTGRLWAPLYLAAALGLGAGLTLVLLDPARRGRLPLRIASAAALVTLLAVPAWRTRPSGVFDGRGDQRYWNTVTLSIGPLLHYKLAAKFPSVRELEREYREKFETLYYRDGEVASVGVFRMKGTELQALKIGGEIEASSGAGSMDMPVQLLSAHLPLLARPGARRALNVGLGSGVTLGAMTLYPSLERLTSIEISPEVVEAASHFSGPNRGALSSPRVTLVRGDARSHLRHSDESYDVISSQPSSFWAAGGGALFTVELYRAMRDRLSEEGVACQWLPGSRVRGKDFQAALRGFLEVFPEASLWTPGNQVLLLGWRKAGGWSREWIETCLRNPAIGNELAELGIDRPEALFRHHRAEGGELRRLAGEGRVESETRPLLEYSAPWGILDPRNEVPLLLFAEPVSLSSTPAGFDPGALEAIETYRRRGALLQALDSQLSSWRLSEAIEGLRAIGAQADPWLSGKAAQLVGRYSPFGDQDLWRLFLRRALLVMDDRALHQVYLELGPGDLDPDLLKLAQREALPGDWTVHLLVVEEALKKGESEKALEAVEEARDRGAPAHRLGLAEGFAHALNGHLDAAERSYREALESALKSALSREAAEILYNLGIAREKRGDLEGAIVYQGRSLAGGADAVRGGIALARCLRGAGRAAEALAVADEVSKKRESAEAHYEAARCLLDLGNRPAALERMAQAAAAAPDRYLKELEALEK